MLLDEHCYGHLGWHLPYDGDGMAGECCVSDGAIKILRLSTLYPNAEQPRHGVFTEQNLRHLLTDCAGEISATVVAPIPWFPSRHQRFGRYAQYASVPDEETRYGVRILHPRYPVLPKIGMSVAPWLMASALLPVLRRLDAQAEKFDLIDAHYFYPDGVAAVWLGIQLRKPVVVTALGTDVNWIPRYRLPRLQLRWAAARAQGLASVSHALAEHLGPLGVTAEQVRVLRNGVDLNLFKPLAPERDALRGKLGIETGPILLSVGGLIERKGHHLVIEALRDVPGATLLIAGEGPMRAALEKQIARQGLKGRARLLGPVSHGELPRYYNAADIFVLATSREGMPNVVLEALACGTPVVACDAEGVREQLADPIAGLVVGKRDPAAIAESICEVLARQTLRDDISGYAQRFSWESTSLGQLALFRQVLSGYDRIDRE